MANESIKSFWETEFPVLASTIKEGSYDLFFEHISQLIQSDNFDSPLLSILTRKLASIDSNSNEIERGAIERGATEKAIEAEKIRLIFFSEINSEKQLGLELLSSETFKNSNNDTLVEKTIERFFLPLYNNYELPSFYDKTLTKELLEKRKREEQLSQQRTAQSEKMSELNKIRDNILKQSNAAFNIDLLKELQPLYLLSVIPPEFKLSVLQDIASYFEQTVIINTPELCWFLSAALSEIESHLYDKEALAIFGALRDVSDNSGYRLFAMNLAYIECKYPTISNSILSKVNHETSNSYLWSSTTGRQINSWKKLNLSQETGTPDPFTRPAANTILEFCRSHFSFLLNPKKQSASMRTLPFMVNSSNSSSRSHSTSSDSLAENKTHEETGYVSLNEIIKII